MFSAPPAEAPLPPAPAEPELWYLHHCYLNSEDAVESSEALIDKAAAAGYKGVAIWDSGINFMSDDFWPWENEDRLHEVMKHAAKKRMKVLAAITPFGYSNEALQYNPNLAEAERIIGAQFQVDGSGHRLVLKNSFPGLANPGFEQGKTAWFDTNDRGIGINTVAHSGKTSAVIVDAPANARLRQKFALKPWRQYHLRLFYKSSNFKGSAMLSVFDSSSFDKVRLNAYFKASGTHDWTQVDYTFNSQNSTEGNLYLGVWGGSSGILWFDDIQIEETALVYVTRRPGTPLKVYDPDHPATVYREGVDYNYVADPRMLSTRTPFSDNYHDPGPITLPAGSHLSPGQTVAMDFYAAFPIPATNGISMCMTEPWVLKWQARNGHAIKHVLPSDGGLLLAYDEIRQMNSCGSCRAKNLSAGQLLAWSVQQSIQIYNSVAPGSALYIWSDMFDPYHNARQNYYYVEGDLSGSWKGLPSTMTIMNWNLGDLKNSLTWFSGLDSRQPVPHPQIIAGYYDPETHDGADAARQELAQAAGIPHVMGLMYTTWNEDYSQLQSFATSAKANWGAYVSSVSKKFSASAR